MAGHRPTDAATHVRTRLFPRESCIEGKKTEEEEKCCSIVFAVRTRRMEVAPGYVTTPSISARCFVALPITVFQ